MISKPIGAVFAAGIILASFAANAADLPRPTYKGPVYTAPAGTDWSGFYVGLNAGYAFGTSNLTSSATQTGYFVACPTCVTAFNSAGAGSVSPKGFTGGLQLGYNWQMTRFVFGLEADINAFSLKGSRAGAGDYTPVVGIVTVNQEVKTDWLATVRPRIGYAFDNFLPYVTGGLAATQLKYTASASDTFAAPATGSGSTSKLKLGWTAGFGVEYALFSRWSVKAEYLYVKFGAVSTDYIFNSPLSVTSTQIANSADLKAHVARLGVNYRF